MPITINKVDLVEKAFNFEKIMFQHMPSINCQPAVSGFISIHPFYLQCDLSLYGYAHFLLLERVMLLSDLALFYVSLG